MPPNREAWLTAAVDELRGLFRQRLGTTSWPLLRVSCGWPSASPRKVAGTCHAQGYSADGVNEVFVSPKMDDPVQILGVLVHELVHVLLDSQGGHGPAFRKLAVPLGLTDKMTTTTESDDLKTELHALAEDLGLYPHRSLTLPEKAARTGASPNRQLKVQCLDNECGCGGYVARTTRKWLDAVGAPMCPRGSSMVEAA